MQKKSLGHAAPPISKDSHKKRARTTLDAQDFTKDSNNESRAKSSNHSVGKSNQPRTPTNSYHGAARSNNHFRTPASSSSYYGGDQTNNPFSTPARSNIHFSGAPSNAGSTPSNCGTNYGGAQSNNAGKTPSNCGSNYGGAQSNNEGSTPSNYGSVTPEGNAAHNPSMPQQQNTNLNPQTSNLANNSAHAHTVNTITDVNTTFLTEEPNCYNTGNIDNVMGTPISSAELSFNPNMQTITIPMNDLMFQNLINSNATSTMSELGMTLSVDPNLISFARPKNPTVTVATDNVPPIKDFSLDTEDQTSKKQTNEENEEEEEEEEEDPVLDIALQKAIQS